MAVVNTPQIPNQASGHKPAEMVYFGGTGARVNGLNREEFLAANPWYVLDGTWARSAKGGGGNTGWRYRLNPEYFNQQALSQSDANFNQGVSGGVQTTQGGSGVVGGPAAESGGQAGSGFAAGIQNSQGRRGRRRSLLAGGYGGVSDPAVIGSSLLGG